MDWGAQTVSLFLCLVILLATIQNGNAERKIVCYYTNWSIYRPGTAKFSPQNINPYLCTHLIYAFGGFTKDNALKPFDKYQDIEKGGYAKFTGLKTYNKNLKTMLAIGGWNEGSSRFSPMVADQERRREFVKNSIKFLRKNHFDGLDLDWEYPAFRDGGKPRDKDNYANLVQELREEFDRESSKTGRPRLLLSLAMPAGIEYVDKGYDVPRLNEYLDFINLLSYDYHSSYEPAVNHHSPLYPLEEDNEYNYDTELTIDYTIEYLLKKGASPEKIILGIPTYGRSYTLFNQDATELGSPADGPGIEGDATREKGYLAYYEICESLAASEDWEVIQPNPKAMGPYAFKGDQWVGYDDEDIVKLKAKYANEKDLGGIMFWTIDNDDFRGKCHDRPYPLIEAAKEALLSDNTNTVQKSKTLDNRKKTRVSGVQSNTVGRKQGTNRRTTTTAASATRKRVTSSPRPKFRTFARPKASVEEEEEKEVDRRSYDPSSDEEEEDNGGNAVRTVDKSNRSREKSKSRPKRPSSGRNRRKQNRHKGGGNNDSGQESLSNKLTTPEPPTTPDPGTDFKCEDEGFFSHPRDCKKYFWCLDAGPGGLGVVAHQFTCPSGLVFNKAADSCDYPRNVVCPRSKTTTVSTTRAPITAATSRTTYLYSSTRKPTTQKPDSEEDYEDEYEDDDEIEEEDEEEEEEVKEEPKVSSTLKPLLYKTITRNRPTTTTTTTTTEAPSTTSKSEKHDPEKVIGSEDEEEDPKVIKELIKLIKKAGGIEELEKQLFIQNKSPHETSSGNEPVTPATISRTLYERVLNRQAGKSVGRQRTSTNKNRANGPGGAQFEGLDEVPEVKTLRRTYKPQYVTIERPKSSTKEPPVEDEELNEEEDLDDDTADVASSEEQSISNPFLASSTQRATPNYINIRRARPSSTTSRNENDVDEKDEDTEEQSAPVRSRRPNISSKSTESSSSEESKSNEESSPTTKSRYINIQRFRSTTPKSPEVVSETVSASQEPITESVSSEAPKIDAKTEAVTTTSTTTTTTTTPTPSTTTFASSTVSTTSNDIVREPEMEEPVSSTTTETVKLVEDSATEILLTTAPASLSTLLTPNANIGAATVSQPRPFGFSRRNRPADTSTTPLPASNDQTRPKVANSEAIRLPTLKELIGYRTNDRAVSPSPVYLSLLDKRANLVLEEDAAPGESVPSLAKVSGDFENRPASVREPWTLEEIDQNSKGSDAVEAPLASGGNELDLLDGRASAYYVEDNIADNEDDGPTKNKKRIDRQDSSTTTPRPTTMRGPPLASLFQSQIPRGFYVTRSETDSVDTRKTGKLTTEPSTLPTMVPTLSMGEVKDAITDQYSNEESIPPRTVTMVSTLPSNTEKQPTISASINSTINDEKSSTAAVENRTMRVIRDRVGSTTPSINREETETGKNLAKTEASPDSKTTIDSTTVSVPFSLLTSSISPETDLSTFLHSNESVTREPLLDNSPIVTTDSSQLTDVTRSDISGQNKVSQSTMNSDSLSDPTSETLYTLSMTRITIDHTLESTTETELNTQKDSGVSSKETSTTNEITDATTQSVQDAGNFTMDSQDSITTPSPVTVKETTVISRTNRRRQKIKFDSVSEFGRRANRHRDRQSVDKPENSSNEARGQQQSGRPVPAYRRRQRRPSTALNDLRDQKNRKVAKTVETKANNSAKNSNDQETSNEGETDDGKKLVPNAIETKVHGEQLPEVNSSKSTVMTTRTPGSPLSTRLRKPTTLSSTSSQNKPSNTLANNRKNRPTDGNEKLDATNNTPELPKSEKDIDQSSRAQEIAVTLAEPPTPPQSATTGRPSLRNALRRRISTTLAPRTDATQSRTTTVRFAPVPRDRQKPKTKDKPQQNVTTRPRRPQVIDYDYYEDEEEPVVGKSTYNGKLFLTSKGTIRCLDQGNFPHPYSCKKFITCAKMVNGQVVGAEYTCPDKLSYDPVGGICNWSAGLGCKE